MGGIRMEMQRCKTCGGSVTRQGNFYVCDYCANKWEISAANDAYAVDRANAWNALRDGDFEKSAELFELLAGKDPNNHETYWGRALAMAGIVYVTDMNEGKKVPTCNNITEDSFIDNKDVTKAISLAPEDIAQSYRKQAEYIDKVRIEWLEKASKEPAYDIFISFKDSDRENGIERTQDSIDAQDLYNALIADGYKVFFSRISLRDKISEQYEPYIYNAIKTAKVMIVFGEKAEYFSSAWVKNEWSRFKTRIQNGEKHKNSLVVVYKNMDPADLPVILRSRQCLNAANMTFLPDLTRHIKRVIDESKKNIHLDKIEISGGQIAKKASSLSVNTVKTHEIGAGAITEISITEKQSINLISTYLTERQWDDVIRLADDVLFNNPDCTEAIWYKLMATYRATSNDALVKSMKGFSKADYDTIERVLNCASKNFAKDILNVLYRSEKAVDDRTYHSILTTILPFSFDGRDTAINEAFDSVIRGQKHKSFQLLLNTLDSSAVDQYISYNLRYFEAAGNKSEKQQCLKSILEVDEGNVRALSARLLLNLQQSTGTASTLTNNLEALLKYSTDINAEVISTLNWLCKNASEIFQYEFAKQLIRYYNGQTSDLEKQLIALIHNLIEHKMFGHAEYFVNLVLSFDANNADAYWATCMIKVKAATEDEIASSDNLLRDVPEFNRYLTLVSPERQKHCISLSKGQLNRINQEEINKLERRRKVIIAGNEPRFDVNAGAFIGVTFTISIIVSVIISLASDSTFLGVLGAFACMGIIYGLAVLISKPSKKTIEENRRKASEIDSEIAKLREDMK